MFIFPVDSLLSSEFEKVKEHISLLCLANPGKGLLMATQPITEVEEIRTLLAKTEEFRNIIVSGNVFPADNYKDISKELNLLRIENSVLQPQQVNDILLGTKTIRAIFQFFEGKPDLYPVLNSILEDTVFEKRIVELIEEVLDDFSQVRSTASPDLARIRKNILKYRAEADKAYNTVLAKYRRGGWLTDSQESTRNGRRVLSIFAEQKRALKGIIHDVSATGKTAFLEPEEVVELNNIVFSLEQDERMEILRVLRELTNSLRRFTNTLQAYHNILAEFDFTRAKALFAVNINAHHLKLQNSPCINLLNARHPLLLIRNKELRKQTIPFSLRLDGTNKILVISGPNAGGKTICLKTIGLLQMMLQSGMLVSCDDTSVMGIFTNLLTDIGDSQSIEYELSTYSSRLKHMKVFLDKANEKTLFLIDEFGSGTDPDLGGALAEAVLEQLHKQNAFGIITTHYMNLKVLADKSKGILNGSMAFDSKNLIPLFKLHVGKPGSSYTFVVAERSGLPGNLINNARSKVNKKHVLLEQLLNKVEKEKTLIAKKSEEAIEKTKTLSGMIERNEKMIFENEQLKNSVESHLKKQEQKIINQYEQQLKRFAGEFKKAKNKKQVLDQFLQQLGFKKDNLTAKQKEDRTINPAIKQGSEVKLYNGKITGSVQSIDGKKATVLFGRFKTTCNLADLILSV